MIHDSKEYFSGEKGKANSPNININAPELTHHEHRNQSKRQQVTFPTNSGRGGDIN